MTQPSGPFEALALVLLRDLGVPALAVTLIGSAIAILQWFSELDDTGHAIQTKPMEALRWAPRTLRAYVLFVLSHILAVISTILLLRRVFYDDAVMGVLGTTVDSSAFKTNIAIVLYFLIVDWWSLRRGDEMPTFLAFLVGTVVGAGLLAFGVYVAARDGDWATFAGWFGGVIIWFRILAWATGRGSALARAIQNA